MLVSYLAVSGRPRLDGLIDVGGDRWVGRVHLHDPDSPLIVEVQSGPSHSALADTAHDGRRLADLRAAGFEVVEITDAQAWHRPDEVVAAVRAARRRLRATV